MLLQIGIIGDFKSGLRNHQATNDALRHAADAMSAHVSANWVPTASLAGGNAKELLAASDAVWAAPGSPYHSLDGMLSGIEFARRHGVPFLGTCGGFQYALIEYARHVLGWADADTRENESPSTHPVITPVACPVPDRQAGAPRLSGVCKLRLQPGTMLARIYGRHKAHEEYFCNFEVNAEYLSDFERAGLSCSAFGEQGELRAVEIPGHPFFVATLFQPQLGSTEASPHPLVSALLRAAARYQAAACGEAANQFGRVSPSTARMESR
jgi:CTP synthase (UTP-ammonia lyase)